MANLSQYIGKAFLDWSTGGAAVTQPAAWFMGLSLAAPTSVASNEVATGSGYLRQSCGMSAAGTPAGSATTMNATAMTFGPFSSSAVISGLFMANTVSSNAGTMLYFGNLTTVRTPLPGDSLVLAINAVIITLS